MNFRILIFATLLTSTAAYCSKEFTPVAEQTVQDNHCIACHPYVVRTAQALRPSNSVPALKKASKISTFSNLIICIASLFPRFNYEMPELATRHGLPKSLRETTWRGFVLSAVAWATFWGAEKGINYAFGDSEQADTVTGDQAGDSNRFLCSKCTAQLQRSLQTKNILTTLKKSGCALSIASFLTLIATRLCSLNYPLPQSMKRPCINNFQDAGEAALGLGALGWLGSWGAEKGYDYLCKKSTIQSSGEAQRIKSENLSLRPYYRL